MEHGAETGWFGANCQQYFLVVFLWVMFLLGGLFYFMYESARGLGTGSASER